MDSGLKLFPIENSNKHTHINLHSLKFILLWLYNSLKTMTNRAFRLNFSLSTILLLMMTTFSNDVSSQTPFEPYFGIGLSAGVSNYTGDLNENFNYTYSQYGVGAHLSCIFASHFGARIAFYNGEVTATDYYNSNVANRARNLAFRSGITEIGIHFIYNVFGRKSGFLARSNLTPYLFAGVALFHFNPQDSINGQWYDLQPLGTEGQTMFSGNYPTKYSLTQACIPFGVGVSYRYNGSFDFGLELGFRKTFTDYLDDISGYYPDEAILRANIGNISTDLSDRTAGHRAKTGAPRGNPTTNDWYIYTNISVTYYFYWGQFGVIGGSKHARDCWSFPEW